MATSQCKYKFRRLVYGEQGKEEVIGTFLGLPVTVSEVHREQCKEEVYGTSPYCILHIDFPDKSDPEYDKIISEKDAKVLKKMQAGNFNFEGAKISLSINLSWKEDIADLNFDDATIKGYVLFDNATIKGDARFDNATIEGEVGFDYATITGDALFDGATIKGKAGFGGKATITGDARFNNAIIEGDAWFEYATIKGDARFEYATITGDARFNNAIIEKYANFNNATIKGIEFESATIKKTGGFNDATIGHGSFNNAIIDGGAGFQSTTIMGDFSCETAETKRTFSFRNTKFADMEAQEGACRKAKQTWEHVGGRDEADYHFYREMEAKRKLKKPDISFKEALSEDRRYKKLAKEEAKKIAQQEMTPEQMREKMIDIKRRHSSQVKKYVRGYAAYFSEFPLQYIIWYWVYPFRVFLTFLGFVVAFGLLFWFVGGALTVDALISTMRSSFFALFVPVDAITKAPSGLLGMLYIIAGFIGLFTWPVFVASLAKKYGR